MNSNQTVESYAHDLVNNHNINPMKMLVITQALMAAGVNRNTETSRHLRAFADMIDATSPVPDRDVFDELFSIARDLKDEIGRDVPIGDDLLDG